MRIKARIRALILDPEMFGNFGRSAAVLRAAQIRSGRRRSILDADWGPWPKTRLPSRSGNHEGGKLRVKAIRRSPVTRVTAWLLTSALIAPMVLVGHAARAQ